jgi:oxaloacetate decarboxylase gamma subunit
MLFGMGSVFVFLTLLVIFTGLMSRLIAKYDARFKSDSVDSSADSPSTSTIDHGSLLAVLTSAIHQYRSKHK